MLNDEDIAEEALDDGESLDDDAEVANNLLGKFTDVTF